MPPNVRALPMLGNLLLVPPNRKAQLKKRKLYENKNIINKRSTPNVRLCNVICRAFLPQ